MKKVFGELSNGEIISVYTISNKAGLTAEILDYGAIVNKLFVPDRTGNVRDVQLGYDDIKSYEEGDKFFGAIIGRNANRIENGKVTLDGVDYQMEINDNDHNLHSGSNGVDKKIWTALPQESESVLTLMCKSNDMEQGLPGNVTITITYVITEDNEFKIVYDAVTDKKTIINLTSHMYFNLNGHYKGLIEDHYVSINADRYNPVKDFMAIPTEEYAPVEGTVFDFRKPKKVGQDINADDEQLKYVQGYDHNYIINGETGTLRSFATVYSEESGINMELFSDQTGMQFYAGNCIGDTNGKGDFAYHSRSGLCFEPQYIPNAVNFIPEDSIDSPVYTPNEHYHSESIYKFTTK